MTLTVMSVDGKLYIEKPYIEKPYIEKNLPPKPDGENK